jgi:hypothetical protein
VRNGAVPWVGEGVAWGKGDVGSWKFQDSSLKVGAYRGEFPVSRFQIPVEMRSAGWGHPAFKLETPSPASSRRQLRTEGDFAGHREGL